ncbi:MULTISPECIES: thioredoxin [unclassified Roseitalea]|uniref:thioredoxin n=1 Tax=unclassified Roseitalea TaxID=2639107 RepID=UPI00273F5BD6|nr:MULTISPECIES: thioredoxin [unclassified Roseitalea]
MNATNNPFAPGGNSGGYGETTVGFEAPSPAPGPAPLAGGAAASGPLIKDTTTADFQADVIEQSRSQPVLIDFWAPWCGPCKQLTPALEAAVTKAGGKVKLVKMNIDEHPAIAGQMGIQSIPAVLAFVDGQPVDGFMGALPESQVTAFIEKLIKMSGGGAQGAAVAEALEQAGQAAAQGDLNGAAQIYAMVLQQDPENAAAYGAMAGLMADHGQAERARDMLDQAPESIRGAPELAAVRTKLELAEKVEKIGDPAALEARLAADPGDHEARFDLAQILNARGEREAAADQLLAIMKADRQWRDDGARAELLKFFEAWGQTDPATVKARRKLSSLLFR